MDATVKGQKVTFSACHDNLPAYREALSRGQPTESIPLHNCTCPPCFSAIERRGKITCEPRCSLDYCDLEYGVCHAEPGGKGGFSPTLFAVIVTVSVVCAITAISVIGYRLYMRGAMRAEVRAIMAQYMPLADSDPVEGRAMLPMTSFALNEGRT
jgi:hypothetical protein